MQNKNTFLFFKTTHFQNNFQKKKNIENFSKDVHLCIHPNMDNYKGCHHIGLFSKTFSNPHTKHHFKQLKIKASLSKQVTKSPWITMDRKGANTFPFYNLLPEPKKTAQRSFLFFLTFPLDKIKSRWRLLLNRNICRHKHKIPSQLSHRITMCMWTNLLHCCLIEENKSLNPVEDMWISCLEVEVLTNSCWEK